MCLVNKKLHNNTSLLLYGFSPGVYQIRTASHPGKKIIGKITLDLDANLAGVAIVYLGPLLL
jgi:hypothetical protein